VSNVEKYQKELATLNLKTIDDLENLVKPLIKDAVKIIAKQSSTIPSDSHLKSHFGGQPYFEKGEEWPKTKSGYPLGFVFQIFNTKNALPENIKLLQFYFDWNDSPYTTEEDGWLVKIYENINTNNFVLLKKPEENDHVNYCEIKLKTIKSLPDWEGIDFYCENASNLSVVLNPEDPSSHYWQTSCKLIGEQRIKSQLGGYPYWLQGNDAPEDRDYQFLFQLDSLEDEVEGLYFGDCGVVYVFYNSKSKKFEYIMQFH